MYNQIIKEALLLQPLPISSSFSMMYQQEIR